MTQSTLVLKVPASRGPALRERFAAGPFDFRSVPHALFSVKGEGVVATLYTSGKFVIQGASPDLFAARWLGEDGARPRAEAAREAPSGPVPASIATIGSDEVGKGDYFGPLVVAAVLLEPGQAEELRGSGVRDSKTLTDEQCLRLGAALRSRYAVAVERLDPAEYNRVYKAGKLNDLLADQHAKAIRRLARPGLRVVVDRFANEKLLEERLRALKVQLEQRPRAESEPAVAAASVVAREEFLVALKELGEEAAIDLHKGAGEPVDRAGRRYVALHGADALSKVAKLHFKNTQKILHGRGGAR